MINAEDLKKLVPNTPIKTLQEFADNFNKFAPKYGIDTLSRVSSFVGNSAIESFIKPIKEIGSKDYFIRMYWSNRKKAKELGKKNEGKEYNKQMTKDKAAKEITNIINSRAKFNKADEYLKEKNEIDKIKIIQETN
jgi:hypothetical protein